MQFLKQFLVVLLFIALGVGLGLGIFYLQRSSPHTSVATTTQKVEAKASVASTVYTSPTYNVTMTLPKDVNIVEDTVSGYSPVEVARMSLMSRSGTLSLRPTDTSLYILQNSQNTTAPPLNSLRRLKSSISAALTPDTSFTDTTFQTEGVTHSRYFSSSSASMDIYTWSKEGNAYLLLKYQPATEVIISDQDFNTLLQSLFQLHIPSPSPSSIPSLLPSQTP